MPRKCPTGKRARIPAPAAGSPLIVSHADDTRYGLLYAATAGSWKFCSAGMF
jgi:hypothetical protein